MSLENYELTTMIEIKDPNKETSGKNNPMEIVIKPEALDLSNLKEGEGNKSYRPSKFEDYIGQLKAKARIECYIEGCKKFDEIFPNTFLSANAGCGKTLLANILADMLGKKFVTCTGGEIKSEQQLVDKIVECEGGILFLDEAHRISNKIGTFMLPILEEYKVSGQKIKPFTCIFATTHKGNLSENLSALLQRFPLSIELENYTTDELITIFKKFVTKQYPNETIEPEVFQEIAENCRFTPRLGLSLLKEYIYIRDWEKIKTNNNIVKDGLTVNDINILKYLDENDGAGKASLAKYLRVEAKTFEFEIEPFLIYKRLISVGNKRKITQQGKLLLGELKCT